MTSPITDDALLEQTRQYVERLQPRIDALMAADPQLKPWTAMTIAQDEAGAERARERIKGGADPLTECHLVGSYARFGLAVDVLPRKVLFANIIDLWRGSDPDDTDPRFLAVWKDAWMHLASRRPATRAYLHDGPLLPQAKKQTLFVYRGQDGATPTGCAWSLDLKVAERFATGAATRQRDREGTLIAGYVKRSNVLAYITGRGESEVIIDPADLMAPTVIAQWQRVAKP